VNDTISIVKYYEDWIAKYETMSISEQLAMAQSVIGSAESAQEYNTWRCEAQSDQVLLNAQAAVITSLKVHHHQSY